MIKKIIFITLLLVFIPIIQVLAINLNFNFTPPANFQASNNRFINIQNDEASLIEIDEFLINDFYPGFQVPEFLLKLNDGNILVLYLNSNTVYPPHPLALNSPDNSGTHVAGKIINPEGETIVSEFQINDYIISGQSQPRATLLNNGNIFITWTSSDTNQDDNQNTHIAAKIISYDGSNVSNIKNEFTINDVYTGIQNTSSLVTLNNNNVYIIWSSGGGLDGSGTYIAQKVFDQDGNALANETVLNQFTQNNQIVPRLKKLSNGNIVAAWESYDTTQDPFDSHIAAMILDSNDPTSTVLLNEIKINTTNQNRQKEVSIEELSNNNILFSWTSNDANNGYDNIQERIAARVIDQSGNEIIPEFTINQFIDGNQNLSQLTRLANNNILVTFTSQTSTHNPTGPVNDQNIAARILSTQADSFITDEFRINNYLVNVQASSHNQLLDNNNILIVWSSNDPNPFPDTLLYVSGKIIDQNGDSLFSSSSPFVTPISSTTNINQLLSFTDQISGDTTGSVTYQLTNDDGTTWYFFDGSDWTIANSAQDSNPSTTIHTNINTFTHSGSINWRAFLNSPTGKEVVKLLQVNIENNLPPEITSYGGQNDVLLDITPDQQTFATVEASDPENGPLTFMLSGLDASNFSLNQNTNSANISFITPINYRKIHNITVTVVDQHGLSDIQNFVIRFDLPQISSGSSSNSSSTLSPFPNTESKTTQINTESNTSEKEDQKIITQKQECKPSPQQSLDIESEITRFEAIRYVIIQNCLQLQELPPLDFFPFKDINYDNPEKAQIIYTAYQNKLIQGYSDKTFKPDQIITYVEAIAINSRFVNRVTLEQEAISINGTWYKIYLNLDLFKNNNQDIEPNSQINSQKFMEIYNLFSR